MALSMYELTIPTMLRGFNVLSNYLDLAPLFASDTGVAPETLLDARLAPDMLSFTGQIQLASDKAKAGVARLARIDQPSYADDEKTFDQLKARIDKTVDFLLAVEPKTFDGSEDRIIELTFAGFAGRFRGDAYLMKILLPDFFFHVATTHDILRSRGMRIGKRDYIGRLD